MPVSRLAAALRDGDDRALGAALDALHIHRSLTPLPEDSLHALFACLGHRTKKIQRAAAAILVRLAPRQADIVERLTCRLTDPDAQVRWAAAFTLCELAQPGLAALPVLMENLGHQESDLRWAAETAVQRLAGRHPQEVVGAVLKLARAGNAVQRRMALYCLRDLLQTDHEARAAYLHGLRDTDTMVRLASLACLGMLRLTSASVRAAVVGLLEHDPDLGVRRSAAAACGRVGDVHPRVVTALRKAEESGDMSLARAARAALKKLSGVAG